MPVVATTFALVAVVWGAIFARRAPLVVGVGVLLVASYAVGHEFWNAHIGPLPLTLDRIVLVAIIGAFAVQWRLGDIKLRPTTGSDWCLIGFVAILAVSALFSGQPEITDGVTSKWGRLLASILIPCALYAVTRQTPVSERGWSGLLVALVVLGIYLACTGILEVAGAWPLVFPRYIANPNLGIHFGRARGPELNSVSLGLYLTGASICAWMLLQQARQRWQQFTLLAVLPLMAFGVLLTFTRSTWIGFAASALVVAAFKIPRQWRWPAVAGSAGLGLLLLCGSWGQLMNIQREGSAGDSEHSVDQRASFAYVSWQMFCDHPVLGVGFGRFYDQKLPYLSDRRQTVELESIRKLHHHNTILSILTETGIIGLAAFFAVFVAWVRCGWNLAVSTTMAPVWVRANGVLMLALIANYLCSAVFHDLTLLPSQEMLLFVFAGLTVNLRQASFGASSRSESSAITATSAQRSILNAHHFICEPPAADRVNLFGMRITRTGLRDAASTVLRWCVEPRGASCRFVVTPNVDHAVLFQSNSDLQAAYSEASLVLADGAPLVLASRIFGRHLPERVAGSDVVPQIFGSAKAPLRVFLLGAGPGVAERAAAAIQQQWPGVKVVGTYSPPIGFETIEGENERIFEKVKAASTDLLIIGLGAPRQELWAYRHRESIPAKVAICAGATIDFLAGHRRRSPVWMRRMGLEWFHRVCAEPRRLTSRYARDAWVFPQLMWREWRHSWA